LNNVYAGGLVMNITEVMQATYSKEKEGLLAEATKVRSRISCSADIWGLNPKGPSYKSREDAG
jgi:hypothetical protein